MIYKRTEYKWHVINCRFVLVCCFGLLLFVILCTARWSRYCGFPHGKNSQHGYLIFAAGGFDYPRHHDREIHLIKWNMPYNGGLRWYRLDVACGPFQTAITFMTIFIYLLLDFLNTNVYFIFYYFWYDLFISCVWDEAHCSGLMKFKMFLHLSKLWMDRRTER